MSNLTSLGTGSSVLLSVCGGRFRAVLSLSRPGTYTLYGPGFCENRRAGDVAAAEAEAVAVLQKEAARHAAWQALVEQAWVEGGA